MSRPRLILLHGDPSACSALAARYAAAHPAVVRLEVDEIATAHLAAGHDVVVTRATSEVQPSHGVDLVELEVDAGTDPEERLRALVARLAEGTSRVDRSIDQPGAATLAWAEVVARLGPARSYWLATTGRYGGPHVAPVWGAVHEETLYLYSERSTVKARNLAADPRLALHLDDAEDVVIVHGTAQDLGRPADCPDVMAAFATKYAAPGDAAYLPDADPAFDVLWAVRPSRALTWTLEGYERSQRRWVSPPPAP